MKDNETKNKFIELRAKGFSFAKISKELKTSKQTLVTWSKDLTLEIKNLKVSIVIIAYSENTCTWESVQSFDS